MVGWRSPRGDDGMTKQQQRKSCKSQEMWLERDKERERARCFFYTCNPNSYKTLLYTTPFCCQTHCGNILNCCMDYVLYNVFTAWWNDFDSNGSDGHVSPLLGIRLTYQLLVYWLCFYETLEKHLWSPEDKTQLLCDLLFFFGFFFWVWLSSLL